MEAGNYVRSNAPGKNNASKTGDPGNAVKNNEAYSTDAETASSNNAGKPFAPGDAGNHYAYGTACRSTAPTADGKDPGNAIGSTDLSTASGNDPGNAAWELIKLGIMVKLVLRELRLLEILFQLLMLLGMILSIGADGAAARAAGNDPARMFFKWRCSK